MRILYLVPYAPTRIRTRPYNLIRQLARRGHQITLATLTSNQAERDALEQMAGEGIHILAAPFSKGRALSSCLQAIARPLPFQAVYSWNPALAARVADAVAQANPPFDIVHVEHLRGAQYGIHLKQTVGGFRTPIVWDSVDCITTLFTLAAQRSASPFGRMASRIELRRTPRYEGWLVRQFDRTCVTTEQDKRALLELSDGGQTAPRSPGQADERICVLKNGVDLDYFRPLDQERDKQTIVLSGKMSYHANVTAARYLVNEIMPHVWRELPETRVELVGADPPRQVMELAAQDGGRIEVTGEVPDIRLYLARATVATAPIVYGVGIQNKVLEAMALATPVVASPQAVSALTVRDGAEVLVGGNAEEFARQTIRLLTSRALRHSLGENGRAYVEQQHDWARTAEQLDNIYLEAVKAAPRAAGMEADHIQ